MVIGASGQVGGALLHELGERATGITRSELDLEDAARRRRTADLPRVVDGADVICIAAGFTHVDGCEQDPSRAATVNRDGPAAIAAATRAVGGRTVYFSTEYVFDGEAGPYGEDDEARPLSVYGRSKWEGEQAVMAADPRALIVRTIVVYGPEARGKNFAYQLAARLRGGEMMRVPADQVSSPTYNPDLAAATVALADRGTTGVVHVAGRQVLDRASFARRLAKAMGLDERLVHDVATAELGQRAARPLRAGLVVDRLRALVPSLAPHDVDAAVSEWERRAPPVPWSDQPC